ncbi:MAG: Crp/Fnr family transcriptional regulator [Bdellovibrionales bacterium]|nr:Crp/Fnr family transcriptional regulator [Bdellovibrionales bacterium]
MGIKIGEDFMKKFGRRFPAESPLAREGEPGSTMFIIASGKVVVTKDTPAGEKVLATLGEGDFFGEMAIMGMQDRRAASVKTVLETTVLELSRDAFEGLIRRSPEIAMSVIKSLTERVRETNGKVAALIHKNDNVRIAAYLNFLTNDRGREAPRGNPGRCFIFKTEAIASTLAIPSDVVGKWMALARKAKVLGQNGEWIWVPYPQYLLPFGEFIAARL